jgi:RNA 2',3'-cyclic 3'-phosphodiesterase
VRLFVALELPGGVRDALAAWATQVTGGDEALRAVAPGALHLTLAFLGVCAPAEVGPIAEAAARGVRGGAWPAALGLGEALWLAPRRPHVLTVAVEDPGGALGALRERVVAELAGELGWEPEQRRFRAHVTVARVRRGRAPRGYDVPAPPRPGAFGAAAVAVMRSELGAGGARYERLATVGPEAAGTVS